MRPAPLLAGESFDAVAALIDRGISADDSQPRGAIYLPGTSDAGVPRLAGDHRLRAGEKQLALQPPFSAAYRVERLRD